MSILIKIGGAALTAKSEYETLCPEGIRPHLSILQTARRSTDEPIILIHGAGSFGHLSAARANLTMGGTLVSADEIPLAIAQTRASATKLNNIVTKELIELGIPAVGISPFPDWTCSNRKIVAGSWTQLPRLIEAGLLPVLHGETVLDDVLGCTILSGDTIMEKLAQEFRPRVAVFMTNTEGVYDKPPEEHGARLIRNIRVNSTGYTCSFSDGTVVDNLQTNNDEKVDTTGGMLGKIGEACQIARNAGVPVRIVKSSTQDALQACLATALPSEWIGTEITIE